MFDVVRVGALVQVNVSVCGMFVLFVVMCMSRLAACLGG